VQNEVEESEEGAKQEILEIEGRETKLE